MESKNPKIKGYSYGKDRLYNTWNAMIGRCYRESSKNFKNYGGRGIVVCEEWRKSFLSFKGWAISAGYDYSLSRKDQQLDRIDNDGNYCPENCRWVSSKENNKNRRYLGRRHVDRKVVRGTAKNSVVVSINGEDRPLLDLCEEYGVSAPFVVYRIRKMGMTPYEALTTPKVTMGRPKKEL